ncbi:extracellular solute-binding protein [Nonomuraea sp. K274]|uniref:Extracellular solute-binding protein n=1 Tax=Nonomuraea cypriaca TaxID=1187855 RepID=A0A931ALA8_9ACTN|nr:extracellular solute-binding protein [Nonomuraea cypriaca]MBF8193875.1 extracellular solute-binding protein [Nonomuraea cypriaca]
MNWRTRKAAVALVAVGSALLASACSGGGVAGGSAGEITFWTQHTTPERLAKQEAVARRFTEQTGIAVRVAPMAASDQNQALVTGAASGNVPDVVLSSQAQLANWAREGLLDTEVPKRVVGALGAKTFSDQALKLATVDGSLAAVPSDGWGHLIVYRTDLLKQAGIAPPRTIAQVADAAERLAAGGRTGMALGTQPGDSFTTESLEAVLLANGCSLVEGGAIRLESTACVHGLGYFQRLAESAGPGELNVNSTRAGYLKGDAAMALFSSHILDEIAGLDPNNPVSCPECARDPAFLVKNTGVLTQLTGPDNPTPTQFGQTFNLAVPSGAHAEQARRFIEFLLGDGYIDSLGIATEGRIPLRTGTTDDPTKYSEAWTKLPFGATPDSKKSLADVYSEDIVDAVADGVGTFTRWGFGTDGAALAGSVVAQNTLAQEIGPLESGEDPRVVAATLAARARDLQKDVSR